MVDTLFEVQQLQFKDRERAERLVLRIIRETFSLDAVAVELRPLAVSLNSFNGRLRLRDGTKLFFKSHTEPGSTIDEYYNSEILHSAGYPVLMPRYASRHAGTQLLVYDDVESPSVFDVADAIEQGDETLRGPLTTAQERADCQLMEIYSSTLQDGQFGSSAEAAVHQLFHHRLVGGRFEDFYKSPKATFDLPGLGPRPVAELFGSNWEVNGQFYAESIWEVVSRSERLLDPARPGCSIVGHGDAHNGNVFFSESHDLTYFDPAFAGRHNPLLDLTKPLYHNVFARWLYFPSLIDRELSLSVTRRGDTLVVTHDYELSSLRTMFLESKIVKVVTPFLGALAQQGLLDPEWRALLKSALFCCPMLTMNIADAGRFPPAVCALALASSIEMGSEGQGERSTIDRQLDLVEDALKA
jgi:hypothetical protein